MGGDSSWDLVADHAEGEAHDDDERNVCAAAWHADWEQMMSPTGVRRSLTLQVMGLQIGMPQPGHAASCLIACLARRAGGEDRCATKK